MRFDSIKISPKEWSVLVHKASWFGYEYNKKILELRFGKVYFVLNKFIPVVHCLLVSNDYDNCEIKKEFNWLLTQI